MVFRTWIWTYNRDISPISVVFGKTISATGIPSATDGITSDLSYLVQYLEMPILNQYILVKTTSVKIEVVANDSQVIIIISSKVKGSTIYIISEAYVSNQRTYNQV